MIRLLSALAWALLSAGLLPLCHAAPVERPDLRVDWASFLKRHDLIWEQLPNQWNEGAFIGNGQLGLMAFATTQDNRIDFHLGRQDVTDHRKAPQAKTSMGVPGATVLFDYPRLDLGKMALRPAGKIKSGTMRLHLWNAELTASVSTDLGELQIRAVTLRDRMVQMIQVHSTERTADGKPARWRWEFLPGNPASPRAQVFPDKAAEVKYQTNPNPQVSQLPATSQDINSSDAIGSCVQPLLAGGDYATAWLEKPLPAQKGLAGTLFLSTANEVPAAGASLKTARADIQAAATQSSDSLIATHRSWWHAFYPASFLTIPDPQLEAFYWIQLYKFASASREDGPAVDLFGPWFRVSQWPGIWWNLNIQLTYWPVYASNHLALGNNYLNTVDAHFDGLFKGFKNSSTLGDFAWTLHNYWWQLRFAGDWRKVRSAWLPKAKLVLDGYLPRLKPNQEGKLELDPMGSPEYHGFKPYPNTNYNLAILRWLLNAMIEANAQGSGPADPAAAEWKRILDQLIPPPVDQNGLRIASNQAVDMSHRHYSHLLGLYPLYQLSPDDPPTRELVVKSVLHWHRIGNGKGLAGYSYTGGASLYASLGMGDAAYGMLHHFLNQSIGISELLSNTMYVESGGRNPVIETPLSAASATMDLLLQSWGGKIRVFPAIPKSWQDTAFHQLRAMDGFLVSAGRAQGQTGWVFIQSEKGLPCILKMPEWANTPVVSGSRAFRLLPTGPNEWKIDLKAGECVMLRPQGGSALPVVQPLPSNESSQNPYGVKAGKGLSRNQNWPEAPLPKP